MSSIHRNSLQLVSASPLGKHPPGPCSTLANEAIKGFCMARRRHTLFRSSATVESWAALAIPAKTCAYMCEMRDVSAEIIKTTQHHGA